MWDIFSRHFWYFFSWHLHLLQRLQALAARPKASGQAGQAPRYPGPNPRLDHRAGAGFWSAATAPALPEAGCSPTAASNASIRLLVLSCRKTASCVAMALPPSPLSPPNTASATNRSTCQMAPESETNSGISKTPTPTTAASKPGSPGAKASPPNTCLNT